MEEEYEKKKEEEGGENKLHKPSLPSPYSMSYNLRKNHALCGDVFLSF